MARLTSAERSKRYRERHPEKIKAYKESGQRKKHDKKYRDTHGVHPASIPGTDEYIKYRKGPKYGRSYISSHLKRKYGITYEDYVALLDSQGGVCKICGEEYTRKSQTQKQFLPLFVDHCHKTGLVRGLLCARCNSGLGMFRENEEYLMNAISYLKVDNHG